MLNSMVNFLSFDVYYFHVVQFWAELQRKWQKFTFLIFYNFVKRNLSNFDVSIFNCNVSIFNSNMPKWHQQARKNSTLFTWALERRCYPRGGHYGHPPHFISFLATKTPKLNLCTFLALKSTWKAILNKKKSY